VELSFRIKFSLIRKLSGYELPAISKWHNVISHFTDEKRIIKQLKPKMKKIYILLLTIISYSSFSQNVTLDELLSLRKGNLATVEEKLTNKGWDYSSGTESETDKLEHATFTYHKSSYGNGAESFIFYSYNEDWKRIGIQILKKDIYNSYLARLKSLGCKLIKSNISEGDIEKVYKSSTMIFKITISNEVNENSSTTTVYNIFILEYADYKNNFDPEYDLEGYPSVYLSEKSLNAGKYRENGETKLKLKNYTGALADFNKALQTDKEDGGWCYAYRGLAKFKLKDIDGANKDFEKAKEVNEGIGFIAYANGSIANDEKRYQDALLLFDLSIMLDHNDGRKYTSRGNTKLRLGQKQGACSDFKKASDLGDEDGKKVFREKCN
jgi:tetratricopeptide (TPR) repeat protein